MTAPTDGTPAVTVRFADAALVALVVDAARRVDGVVRLQRRPLAATRGLVRRPTGARGADRSDASAVTLDRSAGAVEVTVRLVSTLRPTPVAVVAGVVAAVTGRLAAVGFGDVRVEVTVTDVQR